MNTRLKISILTLISLLDVKVSRAAMQKDTSASALIDTYIHSFMHSNSKELKHVLDDDAVMKIPRSNGVVVETKPDLVREAQANEGTALSIAYEAKILSASKSIVLAKVTFKFNDFDEDLFITAEYRDDHWKITQLIKMFSDR